jgi:hypothetical protein
VLHVTQLKKLIDILLKILPGMYLHRIWTNRAMCQIQISHFICHYGRENTGREVIIPDLRDMEREF